MHSILWIKLFKEHTKNNLLKGCFGLLISLLSFHFPKCVAVRPLLKPKFPQFQIHWNWPFWPHGTLCFFVGDLYSLGCHNSTILIFLLTWPSLWSFSGKSFSKCSTLSQRKCSLSLFSLSLSLSLFSSPFYFPPLLLVISLTIKVSAFT